MIGFENYFGVMLSNNADGWLVQGNDFESNAQVGFGQDNIDISNLASGAQVIGVQLPEGKGERYEDPVKRKPLLRRDGPRRRYLPQ